MVSLTKDNLFKPSPSRAEMKSRTTDEIARAITADETAKRERKTERLRAMRQAREAESQALKEPETPKKKSGASTARRKKA